MESRDSVTVNNYVPSRPLPPESMYKKYKYDLSDKQHSLLSSSGKICRSSEKVLNITSKCESLHFASRSLASIIIRITSFLWTPTISSQSPLSKGISGKLSANKPSIRNNLAVNDPTYKNKPDAVTSSQDVSKMSPCGGQESTSNPTPTSTATPSKGKHVSPYAPLLQRNNRSQSSQKGLTDRVGVPEMIAMYAINTADKYTTTNDFEEYLSKFSESNVGTISTGINRSVSSRHSHIKGSQGSSRGTNQLGGLVRGESCRVSPSLSANSLLCLSGERSVDELPSELSFNEQRLMGKSTSAYCSSNASVCDKKLKVQSKTATVTSEHVTLQPAANIQAPKSYSTSKLFSLPYLSMTKK